ncbi:MAG TPA: PAS domain S-box protein [Victivallales bacterium]|nr:PAS domain S-box protein [Victivallales bacterium]
MNIFPSEISDLEDSIPSIDKSEVNTSTKIPVNILLENYINDIDKLTGNYGEISDDKIKKLIYLENYVKDTHHENIILKKQMEDILLAVNSTPVMIYIKDSHMRYRFINDSYIRAVGNYSRDEIINSTSSYIFGIKEIKQIMVYEQKSLSENIKIENAEIYIPGSNRKRTGLLSILPVFNKSNAAKKIICTIRETSDTKVLMQRFKLMESALDATNEYVYLKTLFPEKFEYRSRGIEYLTGWTREDFYKDEELWNKLIHPDDEHMLNYETLQVGLNIFKFRIIHKTGEHKWIENRVHKLRNFNKINTFYYFGFARDITKDIENEELNEILKINSDIMPIGIIIRNIQSDTYMYLNQAFERLTGYSKAFIMQNKAPYFFTDVLIYPDDLSKYMRYYSNSKCRMVKLRILTENKNIKLIKLNKNFIEYKGKKCKLTRIEAIK